MQHSSIADMAKALQSGTLSSVELTQHFLERIATHDTSLNSFITVTQEDALVAARDADACIARGEAGPLTGIPFAHKDLFCTEGVRTTCGSKMLDNFVAPYDATVVGKTRAHGLVMLGKTNMDEFAMGSSNENSFYGPVHNPWDLARVPGGSSGGSAAAVAAGLVPLATCTDTGGSIRAPAALCGITGIKPTYGRVSRFGMIAFASSLDQGGAMGRRAEDCAYLLEAIAGFDPSDSTSIDRPVDAYVDGLHEPLKGLRIGVPKEYFDDGLDAGASECVHAALKEYEQLGATIKEVSLPRSKLAIPTYYVVAPAECSSNLARYDGVRFGYRAQNPKDLDDLYTRSRTEAFGAEVKRRIMIGTYVLSAGYFDAYYLKAQKVRRLISEDFQRVFSDVDIIAGPTTPGPAFAIGEKADDPVTMYLFDIYTTAINLAGLPAMSVPAGFVDGLPVGLQLIGNYFEEGKLLNAAHQFQCATSWHECIPEKFA